MDAFPGRDELIERAFRRNSSFRDLCQDYRKCATALERWRRSDSEASSVRAREYADLLAELELELEGWLDIAANDGVKPTPGEGLR